MLKREGPDIILTNQSVTSYDIADPASRNQILGTYHILALKPYDEPQEKKDFRPAASIKRRSHPRKGNSGSSLEWYQRQGGVCNRNDINAI